MNYKRAAKGRPQEISWSRPRPGSYKLNIDTCFFPNGTGAVDAVIRNDKGEAVAGIGDPMINLLDAATSEALALQRGLKLVDDLGCTPVTVEMDSLELVEAFNGVTEIWSPYTAILTDFFRTARRIG